MMACCSGDALKTLEDRNGIEGIAEPNEPVESTVLDMLIMEKVKRHEEQAQTEKKCVEREQTVQEQEQEQEQVQAEPKTPGQANFEIDGRVDSPTDTICTPPARAALATPVSTRLSTMTTPWTTPWTSTTTSTTAIETPLTDVSSLSIKNAETPIYLREAAIVEPNERNTTILVRPCLQCAILKLPCDKRWPTCSRCMRRRHPADIKQLASELEQRKAKEPCLARRAIDFHEAQELRRCGLMYRGEPVLARLEQDQDSKTWEEKVVLENEKMEPILGVGREAWRLAGLQYLPLLVRQSYRPAWGLLGLAGIVCTDLKTPEQISSEIAGVDFAPRGPFKISDLRQSKLKDSSLRDKGFKAKPLSAANANLIVSAFEGIKKGSH